jgi:hypothetical protein
MPISVRFGGATFLLLAFLAGSANASDTVTWRCYHDDQFSVLSTDKNDSVGQKFVVRRSTGALAPDCAVETRQTDRLLGTGDGDSHFYIALRDGTLVLDNGTGPDRWLVIYDLASGKRLLSAPYSTDDRCDPTAGCQSDDFRVDKDGVTFWRATRIKVNAQNCPGFAKTKAQGLAPTIVEKTLFKFASVTLESLKTRRCTTLQSEADGSYTLNGVKHGE